MAKFEETTINNGAQNKGKETPKGNQGIATWKSVTIGGLTGIFFGVTSSVGTNIFAAVKRGQAKAAEELEQQKALVEELKETDEKDMISKATPKAKAKPTPKVAEEDAKVEEKEENIETKEEQKPEENGEGEQNKESEHHEETSFADTFNEAREVQGPGGLFVWEGKVCTTYTEEEWNNLSDQERADFAINAQLYTEKGIEGLDDTPVITDDSTTDMVVDPIEEGGDINEPAPVDTDLAKDMTSDPIEEDEDVVDSAPINPNFAQNYDDEGLEYAQVAPQEVPEEDDSADVQIMGIKTITLPDGEEVDVAHAKIHDEDVAIIDVDQDGYGDIAMADLNHNGTPDEGEIIDLQTKEIITVGSYAQVEPAQPETDPSVGTETDFNSNVDDSSIVDDEGLNFTV